METELTVCVAPVAKSRIQLREFKHILSLTLSLTQNEQLDLMADLDEYRTSQLHGLPFSAEPVSVSVNTAMEDK